jgi:RNA recognition motif-containing protein
MSIQRKKFSQSSKVFAFGIPAGANPAAVKRAFEKFGEVGDVSQPPGKSFAFIVMDYPESARRVVAEMQDSIVCGARVSVRLAAARDALWVGGLPDHFDNDHLKETMELFGPVESAIVACTSRGLQKGYGHVIFAGRKGAELALQAAKEGCLVTEPGLVPLRLARLDPVDVERGFSRRSGHYAGVNAAKPVGFKIKSGSPMHKLASKFLPLYKQYEVDKAKLKASLLDAERKIRDINVKCHHEMQERFKRQRFEAEQQQRVAFEREAEQKRLAFEREREAEQQQQQQQRQLAFEQHQQRFSAPPPPSPIIGSVRASGYHPSHTDHPSNRGGGFGGGFSGRGGGSGPCERHPDHRGGAQPQHRNNHHHHRQHQHQHQHQHQQDHYQHQQHQQERKAPWEQQQTEGRPRGWELGPQPPPLHHRQQRQHQQRNHHQQQQPRF